MNIFTKKRTRGFTMMEMFIVGLTIVILVATGARLLWKKYSPPVNSGLEQIQRLQKKTASSTQIITNQVTEELKKQVKENILPSFSPRPKPIPSI